jgi:hypothetical protein
LDIEPFTFDKGCRTATLFLQITIDRRHESRCLACPFPNCIEQMSEMQKNFLNASAKIRGLYLLYDQGLPLLQIIKDIGIDYKFSVDCLKYRAQIIILLDTWKEIVKYPVMFKYDTVVKVENRELRMVTA